MDIKSYLKKKGYHDAIIPEMERLMTAAYNQALEDAANSAADAIRKNEDPINAILSLKKQ